MLHAKWLVPLWRYSMKASKQFAEDRPVRPVYPKFK